MREGRINAVALGQIGEEVHRHAGVVAKFADLGAEPLGGTPERAAAFIRDEQDKWGRIIREVGIKIN